MTKQLAVSLWFASLLLASMALSAQPAADMLDSKDLGNEAAVTAWLRQHGGNEASRREAKRFFERGMSTSSQKRWGPAAKSFGESAIRYPGPIALRETANADLRERSGRTAERAELDLRHAASIYRAAMAADGVVKTLSSQERSRLQADITCVDEYLRSKKARRDCRPLVYYGLVKG